MSDGRGVLSMTGSDQTGLEMEIALLREQLLRAERRVEELTALADRDPLVGVLNRRAFTRETARAVAGRARVTGTVPSAAPTARSIHARGIGAAGVFCLGCFWVRQMAWTGRGTLIRRKAKRLRATA